MNTYAKIQELEARLIAAEARLSALENAAGPSGLEEAAVEMREAADAILDASKPRRKR